MTRHYAGLMSWLRAQANPDGRGQATEAVTRGSGRAARTLPVMPGIFDAGIPRGTRVRVTQDVILSRIKN
jgi:hypothetical protein